jgi:hypothetical protein
MVEALKVFVYGTATAQRQKMNISAAKSKSITPMSKH